MQEILERALELEREGYNFYLDTANQAGNPLTRELLESLAQDEKRHIERIIELQQEFQHSGQWPEGTDAPGPPLDMEGRVKTIFANLGQPEQYDQADVVNALEKALRAEDDMRRLYREAAAESEAEAAVKFFRALAEEERQHYVALQNVHYYLTQTGDWLSEEESQVWNWMNI